MVTRISANGQRLRLPPAKFASIAAAHNFNLNGPWRSTFEHEFDLADNSVSEVIHGVLNLETSTASSSSQVERLHNIGVDEGFCAKVRELVASLLARCPRTRNIAKLAVERGAFPVPGGVPARDPVIAGNVRIAFSETKRLMAGGVWVFLYSDHEEFVYGDGHFSSFGIGGGAAGSCIVPLLPTVAAAYVKLIGPYRPGVRTIRLHPREVRAINELTQIYSRDYLFVRSQSPQLIRDFTVGEHRMVEFHRFEWLESIKRTIEVPDPLRGRCLSSSTLDLH